VSLFLFKPAEFHLTVNDLSICPIRNFEITIGQSIFVPDILGNEELLVHLLIKRSKAVQVFVVATVITNCTMLPLAPESDVYRLKTTSGLATTAFLIIVAAALVFPQHQIYSEMFVVPVGALFAFTSIRVNLPGAPDGFGK
jgi:hypothetical protein